MILKQLNDTLAITEVISLVLRRVLCLADSTINLSALFGTAKEFRGLCL